MGGAKNRPPFFREEQGLQMKNNMTPTSVKFRRAENQQQSIGNFCRHRVGKTGGGCRHRRGFSLLELLIGSSLLLITIAGVLMSYLRCIELAEISRNSSSALQTARSKMEQVKATPFDQIVANFNNITFDIANLNAKGVSYVDSSNPDLLKVTISVCWKQRNGRLFGEDANLNGLVNTGEDKNANGILDSPIQLVMNIFTRT